MQILYSYGFNDQSSSIILKNKNISKIDPNTFKEMKNLTLLDLSNNQISTLDFTELTGLSKLKSLKLAQNSFSKLQSYMFQNQKSLKDYFT